MNITKWLARVGLIISVALLTVPVSNVEALSCGEEIVFDFPDWDSAYGQVIASWDDPHYHRDGKVCQSWNEVEVDIPQDGEYEVCTYFNANSGNDQQHEEYNLLVNSHLIGHTTDPNIGNDFVTQCVGTYNFKKGKEIIRAEHRWNYYDFNSPESLTPYNIRLRFKCHEKPELDVVKTSDKTNVSSGDIMVFTINYENTGSGEADGVTITDDYNESYFEVLDADGGTDNGSRVTWNIGTLGSGDSGSVTLRVRVKDLNDGTYTAYNKASIDSYDTYIEYSNKITIKITNEDDNRAPVAIFDGPSQMNEGTTEMIDGRNSYDPDGDTITYKWSCDDGLISNNTDDNPDFTAPSVSSNKYVTCTLEVSDGQLSDTDSGQILIKNITNNNHAPVADAGPDKTAIENSDVELNGSNSYDPDGDTITYDWSCTGGGLSNRNIAKPIFTAPYVNFDTNITCTLTVEDPSGLTDTDTMKILVKNMSSTNNPPIADAGNDRVVNEGQATTLYGSNSYDPDGDTITYKWNCDIGSLPSNTVKNPRYYAPSVSNNTTATCTLTVEDPSGLTDSDDVDVLIKETSTNNNPPVADAGSDKSVQENDDVTLNGSNSYDPDGDTITYKWNCDGGTLSSNTVEKPIFTAPSVNSSRTYSCTLEVKDTSGLTDTDTMEVYVQDYNDPNNPPVADAGSDKNLRENNSVTLNGTGSYDPDGDTITYDWSCTGGTLSNSGIVSPTYTAPSVVYDETFTCTLIVEDPDGLTNTDRMDIRVTNDEPHNNPPVADAGSNRAVMENENIDLDGSGSYDPDNDSLTYDWSCDKGTLSSSNSINPEFTAPSVTSNTTAICTLEVEDPSGLSDTDRMEILIRNENDVNEPDVETDSATEVERDRARLNGDLTDIGGDVYADVWFEFGKTTSYGIETYVQTLTSTGNFDKKIYGLDEDTTYHFRAVAENSEDRVYGEDKTFRTTSTENTAPIADAGSDREVDEGDDVRIDGSGSYDPDGDPITYDWNCERGDLSEDDISRPYYTAPSVNNDTYYICTLTVDDGDLSDTDTMRVEVIAENDEEGPVADAGSDTEVDEDDYVRLDGTDSYDPDGDYDDLEFEWDCESGSLIDEDTDRPKFYPPSVSSDREYTCTLRVEDRDGLSDTDTVDIMVRDNNQEAEVETRSATNVEEDSAQLNGDLIDLGGDNEAEVWFEYGEDTDYDDDTSKRTKTSTGDFDRTISGLDEDTLYHFRAVAETDEGKVYGSDKTFRTDGGNGDERPVADAGRDLDVDENDYVRLDGTDSYDPDGDYDDLEFEWDCESGSLIDEDTDRPKYYPPSVSSNREYTCTLRVEDRDGLTDTDTVDINVRNNGGGGDIDISTNSAVNVQDDSATLRGNLEEMADEDYVEVFFQYGEDTFYGEETSDRRKSNETTFDQDVYGLDEDTLYHFRAVGIGESGEIAYGQDRTFRTGGDDNNNRRPIANAGANRTVDEGDQIRLDGSASYDPDGDDLDYRWTCSSGAISSRTTERPYYTAPQVTATRTYNCTLTVEDPDGLDDTDTVSITVRGEDTPESDLLDITKRVRNMSAGDSSFASVTYASSSDVLRFEIEVTSTHDETLEDVIIRDTLPSRLLYQGSLEVEVDGNTMTTTGDITSGITISEIDPGDTVTISFLAAVAGKDNFVYGTTQLINTVISYNDETSETATCKVLVRKSGVSGIETGITNNFFLDSILFPLLSSMFLVWMFRSRLVGLDKVMEEKKEEITEYRSKKELMRKINKVKKDIV